MFHTRTITTILTLFVAFIFIQSLFFKFSDGPETQYIFRTLDTWASGLGLPSLFSKGGIASQYVVGAAELMASALLLLALFPALRGLRAPGAALGLGVISGAIFFHLFTPLGVAVVNADGSSDGGLLFAMACGVWLSCAWLLWHSRARIGALPDRTV